MCNTERLYLNFHYTFFLRIPLQLTTVVFVVAAVADIAVAAATVVFVVA